MEGFRLSGRISFRPLRQLSFLGRVGLHALFSVDDVQELGSSSNGGVVCLLVELSRHEAVLPEEEPPGNSTGQQGRHGCQENPPDPHSDGPAGDGCSQVGRLLAEKVARTLGLASGEEPGAERLSELAASNELGCDPGCTSRDSVDPPMAGELFLELLVFFPQLRVGAEAAEQALLALPRFGELCFQA